MGTPSEAAVLDALRTIVDPDLHKDIVSLGFVKDMRIDGGAVAFSIELTTPACPVKDLMREQAQRAVSAVPGVANVHVNMTASVRAAVSSRSPLTMMAVVPVASCMPCLVVPMCICAGIGRDSRPERSFGAVAVRQDRCGGGGAVTNLTYACADLY